MAPPRNPRLLEAMSQYHTLDDEGRFKYRLRELAEQYKVTVPQLSREARHRGIRRYLTKEAE